MSFLEKIGMDVIANEKQMLVAMRDAAELWYNELTKPFIELLNDDFCKELTTEERLLLASIAKDMFRAEKLINNGNALVNKLKEIERSIGIPFFSRRKDLKERAETYLNSGIFLKEFVYSSFGARNPDPNPSEIRRALQEAREKWRYFARAKEALVTQINNQLSRIG